MNLFLLSIYLIYTLMRYLKDFISLKDYDITPEESREIFKQAEIDSKKQIEIYNKVYNKRCIKFTIKLILHKELLYRVNIRIVNFTQL